MRPSAAIVAEARRRFTRGNRLYKLGNYAEALLAYQAALDLYPEPAILYNLGQAYEKLRDPAKAALHFERFLQARPKSPDREALQRRIATLREEARVEVPVTSYPPGAAIYVGDRRRGVKGRTPFQLRLPLGNQRLILELEGFIPAVREVDVRLGEANLVDAQLQRRSSVRVDADVRDARAMIDGEREADGHRVPHLFEVEPGRHRIRVALAGHQEVLRAVDLQPGEQLSLVVNMRALPTYGQLQIEGVPGAVVIIDGRTTAHVPMAPLRLATGTYRVAVEREGHHPWEGKITVTVRRLTVARVGLTPTRGVGAKSALWGAVGVSAATLIAGSILGTLALRAEREYTALPERAKLDEGRTKALSADICFAAAAAAALAAVITYFATERGPSTADLSFIAPH